MKMKTRERTGEAENVDQSHPVPISCTLSLVRQWSRLFRVVCRITGLCTLWPRASGPHLLDVSFFLYRIHSLFILHVITSRRRLWPLIGASTPVPSPLFPPPPVQLFVLLPRHPLCQLFPSSLCHYISLVSPLNLLSPSPSDPDHSCRPAKNVWGFPDFPPRQARPLGSPLRRDPADGTRLRNGESPS